MFDRQAEMSALAAAPKVARAVTPPPPSTQQVVSFAQAPTGSTRTASNDNLLVLNKGDKPFSTREIESRLQKLWKTAGAWRMMSLGRGFYEFFFASEMDICLSGPKTSICTLIVIHMLVWIRLLELPQEYWMERTLREIAGMLGTPLVIDNATTKRLFGHYARILVDMDFSRKLFHEIVVEKEGFAFTVNIGHDVTVCRQLYPRQETYAPKERIDKGNKQVLITKTMWVPLKENPTGIGSSLAFVTTTIPEPARVEEEFETETQNNSTVSSSLAFGGITIPEQVRFEEEIEAEPHHNSAAHVQKTTDVEPVQYAPQLDLPNQHQRESTVDHSEAIPVETQDINNHESTYVIPAAIPTPLVITTSLSPIIQNNNLSMQLENISHNRIPTDSEDHHSHILSPLKNKIPDISSIVAPADAQIDPVLQKDINFMQAWLSTAAATDKPFIDVVSKSKKKKNLQKALYITRSQGPRSPFK
ncbi:DUF4283 domain protein [Medicago truncatula]|uniref:DUF4283 domain protein n=1 Tax=Medicago truncatula TaxID=3880 RepID=G7IL11_MEDTR|nr:DUF4283 domain protein [Medicago truncatula]